MEQRILIVDDDDAIRMLLLTVLRKRGFSVDIARNGEEAMQRVQQCRYVLMLLDLMMPRVSGYELLRWLETFPAIERPIVVVVTAGEPHHFSPDIVSATIRKPFDIDMLVEILSASIGMVRPLQQSGTCPPPDSDTGRNFGKPN